MTRPEPTPRPLLAAVAWLSIALLACGAAVFADGVLTPGWTTGEAAWVGAEAVRAVLPWSLPWLLPAWVLARAGHFGGAGRAALWCATVALALLALHVAPEVPGLGVGWVAGPAAGALGGALVEVGPRSASRIVALACALIVWIAAPLLAPRVEAREIAHDLLAEGAWTVVSEREDAPIALGVLTPSIASAKARDDVPSLVLPPPAEARFVVPAGEGAVQFVTRAGIGRRVRAEEGERRGRDLATLLPEGEAVRVHLQAEVDGELRFDGEAQWTDDESAEWLEVTGPEGWTLEPGQEVVLRTLEVDGSADLDAVIEAGFTRLALERVEQRMLEPALVSRPNIVYVVMDTLRADRTGVGGAEKDLTPRLDAFAARGTTWTNAYATSPWTWPSTASLLSGLQPNTHGVLSSDRSFLDSRIDTLAELLQARGYATAAIIGNPLIVRAQNFDQGFQHFRSTHSGVFVDSDVLVPEAIEWLRETAPARAFLYLHLVDPHEPHDPTPEAYTATGAGERPEGYPDQGLTGFKFQINRRRGRLDLGEELDLSWIRPEHRRWMHESYDAAVWTGDRWFGVLLDALDELGMRENTVVVFTSDHGEELLDHGHVEHIHSLWGELVRAPLVVAGPGVPVGAVRDEVVSNRHLVPTLARIGDAYPRGLADPIDLLRPAAGDEPIFFSTETGIWGNRSGLALYGVRVGDHVLHVAPEATPVGGAEGAGDARLFDLTADPGEQDDRSRDDPRRAEALRERVLENLAEQADRAHGGHVLSGEATIEMLERIGYVGSDREND